MRSDNSCRAGGPFLSAALLVLSFCGHAHQTPPDSPDYKWGKCVSDWTGSIPDLLEQAVDWVCEQTVCNDLPPEHHNVQFKGYAVWSPGHHDYLSNPIGAPTEADVISTETKGFFATGNSLNQYIKMVWEWVRGNKYYVNGEVKVPDNTGACNLNHGFGHLPHEPYAMSRRIFETAENKFHLWARNCQWWAKYVITGDSAELQ